MSSHLASSLVARSELVEEFKRCYATFGRDTIAQLQKVYDPAITFIDPLHRIDGWPALERYFAASAANLDYCRFDFVDSVVGESAAFLNGTCTMRTAKLLRAKR